MLLIVFEAETHPQYVTFQRVQCVSRLFSFPRINTPSLQYSFAVTFGFVSQRKMFVFYLDSVLTLEIGGLSK